MLWVLGRSVTQTSHSESVDVIKQKPKAASQASSASQIAQCLFCGGSHERGKCPAWGKSCHNCGKSNHFSRVCRSKNKPKAVQQVSVNTSEPQTIDSDDEYFIGLVNSDSQNADSHNQTSTDETSEANAQSFSLNTENDCREWNVVLPLNGLEVEFKLDTGSQVNLLPKTLLHKLPKKPVIHKSTVKLTAYNNTEIPVSGRCILNLTVRNKQVPVLFIVADITSSPPIIGLPTCDKLNLVQRTLVLSTQVSDNDIINEFSDVFAAFGCISGREYHIDIDPNATPVVSPPHRVPFALKDKYKEELERMERNQIIEKVSEPTEWVNNVVLVEKKSGTIRVCLDPKDLNSAIRRQHYQLPTTEEIFARMSGAKYFSKLDASSGFWQIKVDEDSSKLLVFSTPFGRYKFLRLPFGIVSAPEIFHAAVAEIIEGLDGVANEIDDIIVWGSTLEIHNQRLHAVFERIRQSGLKLNKDKCVIGATELSYLGHVTSDEGIKPCHEKIQAILDMPLPQCKADLQRFLGMVTYLGKFIPNLSTITAPLRKLLEKDVLWEFHPHHEKAINHLKELVTSSPVLQYFDPKLPVRISSDSSKAGLGAVLEQLHDSEWKPVAFASRSLSQAEQNYVMIEKECLSIVFAITRFHEYCYGRSFTVLNDHKPLKAIFTKPLIKAPPRLQRLMLKLQPYDFVLQYVPGKDMTVPDALSRASLKDSESEIPLEELNCMVHSVTENFPMTQQKLSEFVNETLKDPALQVLKKFVQEGWPEHSKLVPEEIRCYYSYRDEIAYADGVLLKGQALIVPTSMRNDMKARIHQGHLEIERCRARARQVLFWPRMSAEIEDMVSSCSTCQENRSYQQKEKLIPHAVPQAPWVKVGSDLLVFNGFNYVTVVDYFSNNIELSRLPKGEANSADVVVHLKSIFARHRIP